jgi:hypothetical protein
MPEAGATVPEAGAMATIEAGSAATVEAAPAIPTAEP